MKIFLGTDHAGYNLKENLKRYLVESGHEVVDCGDASLDENDDFVGFVTAAARCVVQEHGTRAIILGGSGQGEAMAANRIKGVRAVVFYALGNVLEATDHTGGSSGNDGLDIIRLSRRHNNSNVLSFGARFISFEQAKAAINVWLETEYSGDERYESRNRQLDTLEP